MRQTENNADIEYAVMLAILNFNTEFMKSSYSHIQVHMQEDVIDVTLTRQGVIPAEVRLAQSEDGRVLLRQVHEALFMSCQETLRERIEPVVGRTVRTMMTSLDPVSGRSSIAIRLQENLNRPSDAYVSGVKGKAEANR